MVDLIARRPLADRYFNAGTVTLSEGHRAQTDPGLAHIDVTGAGACDLLGIATSGPTRLAALRVTIDWSDNYAAAQIAVERFSADYLWAWLINRASCLTSV